MMKTLIFSIVFFISCIAAHTSQAQFSFLVQTKAKKSSSGNMAADDKPKASPIVGAFTFPFKYRPQTGLFEPSLSLSGAVGVSVPINKDGSASLSFMGSFGPSSISLSSKNSTDTGTTSRSAAPSAFTVLGQWNKVQIALSVGIDDNLDNSTDKWIYQSKPWVSFGIGYSIFTAN